MERAERFSGRLPPHLDTNRIADAVARLRAEGRPFVDLTETNPTAANLTYPSDILGALADPASFVYTPYPCGLPAARAAIASDCVRRGADVQAEDVILTASSSESYSWLFKLLCDPGDAVLVPVPSYPLFEHLARLEGIGIVRYRLDYHGRWEVDVESLRSASPAVRAVVLVSPNNPTGSFVSQGEFDKIQSICRQREWALIIDEVFADYPIENEIPVTDYAVRADVLSFTLGGASKALGLPQVKLGWMIAGGPQRARRSAVASLEHVADTFLSVGTPVQVAAPTLLQRGADVRHAIQERTRRNLRTLRNTARAYPASDVLPVEGGWSAVIRVPATRSEDALVLDLLAHERVLVHPGYFFDFPHEAFIVVSLLPDEPLFEDGIERALRFAN